MLLEAIEHKNTTQYIYPVERDCLIVRIRAARGDIKSCTLVYWARTNPEKVTTAKMRCKQRDALFDYYEVKIYFSKVARYQRYYFKLEDYENNIYYVNNYAISDKIPQKEYFEYLYTNDKDIIKIPDWSKGLIYYHIFPERFYNGNPDNDPGDCESWGSSPTRENYMGGDLVGIIKKLDYLSELGIQCLFINPIFLADFNHKYATTDYYMIDPLFGTNEDFKELVMESHKRNIKIILDGVFNHAGTHFFAFEDVMVNQEKSRYKDWFYISDYPVRISHNNYECVGAYKHMPKLNTSNLEVRKYIIAIMEYWIREFNIDGWRLDVSDEVDSVVWQEARILLKEKYPDTLLLGEVWQYGTKLVSGNQLDCVMNYVFRDAMLDFFAYVDINAKELDSRLNRMLSSYYQDVNLSMYNLLDSHDTARFLFECKEDKRKLRLAVAFQFMFLGSPAIYYGDEVGLTGDNDPDCRRAMVWEQSFQDFELLQWYKFFIKLRRSEKAIQLGEYYTILCNEQSNIFGFVRTYKNDFIYSIFNNSEKECTQIIPLIGTNNCLDLWTKERKISLDINKNENFYNQDLLEYRSKTVLCLKPYSVQVIKQTQEDSD